MRVRYRIIGPARRFYLDDDTMEFVDQEVTTTHPDATAGYRASADAPPVPCLMTDGSPCYVKPIHLKLL